MPELYGVLNNSIVTINDILKQSSLLHSRMTSYILYYSHAQLIFSLCEDKIHVNGLLFTSYTYGACVFVYIICLFYCPLSFTLD